MFLLFHIEFAKALHAERLREARQFALARFVSDEPTRPSPSDEISARHPHRLRPRPGTVRMRDRHDQEPSRGLAPRKS